jgi:hypothetical protein
LSPEVTTVKKSRSCEQYFGSEPKEMSQVRKVWDSLISLNPLPEGRGHPEKKAISFGDV